MDNLKLRGKFNLLLALQTAALLLVAVVGWLSVNELQSGQREVSSQLAKTATLSRVLNGMNVFRTVHVSMIGGAADPAYIAMRQGVMKKYGEALEKDLTAAKALAWSREEQVILDEAIQAFRQYDQGFPVLLAQAQADRSPQAISRLMEGNVEIMRTARDRVLKLQKAAEAAAETLIVDDLRHSSAAKAWIAGVGLVSIVI
ncbi:MAG TPA: MCP four helix bundle domain-containing protein, partial [Geothrix sp.]|nr:MCP four helix bundle domain-containing protein [Geothrix sp.]